MYYKIDLACNSGFFTTESQDTSIRLQPKSSTILSSILKKRAFCFLLVLASLFQVKIVNLLIKLCDILPDGDFLAALHVHWSGLHS